MSLILAALGGLGISFGRLGLINKKHSGGGGGGFTPSLQFNDARNSQYVSVAIGA